MAKNFLKKNLILLLIFILTLNFSVIPTKAENQRVIIGGEPFGLKLYCKGVMVTKFQSISNLGTVCPGKEAGIKINDIITEINNEKIKTNEDLENVVRNSQGKDLKIKILRNNSTIKITAKCKKSNDGNYYLGIWVRDSCAGIGTITYYDATTKKYGGLGHGISDVDTGALMSSENVEIVDATITSVCKSGNGKIGTLNGFFTTNTIGKMGYNHSLGIFGIIENLPNKKEVLVANRNEISIGKASIYTTISGNTPKEYEIEITQICNKDNDTNKNFIFKITDKFLLEKTGGIVQGMSGSPILQNGKIIGAITHVLVNDPTRGYGIYIENMLETTQNASEKNLKEAS